MRKPDLTLLAEAAVGGDQDALSVLIRANQRDVIRFLARMVDLSDVEDLTQETFLRAIQSLPGFAGRSTFRTWLFAIARRVAADAVRNSSRRPCTDPRVDWRSVTLLERHDFTEEHAQRDLLGGLAVERREAFVLTRIAGLSYAEAAEVCGCPIGTIRSRVARAREDLVAAMRDTEAVRRTGT